MTRTITLDDRLRDGEQRVIFQRALADMGVTNLSQSSFERAFAMTKDAADPNGQVPGSRLRAIVDDVVSGMEVFRAVSDSFQ